jgi:hypothetical protein
MLSNNDFFFLDYACQYYRRVKDYLYEHWNCSHFHFSGFYHLIFFYFTIFTNISILISFGCWLLDLEIGLMTDCSNPTTLKIYRLGYCCSDSDYNDDCYYVFTMFMLAKDSNDIYFAFMPSSSRKTCPLRYDLIN